MRRSRNLASRALRMCRPAFDVCAGFFPKRAAVAAAAAKRLTEDDPSSKTVFLFQGVPLAPGQEMVALVANCDMTKCWREGKLSSRGKKSSSLILTNALGFAAHRCALYPPFLPSLPLDHPLMTSTGTWTTSPLSTFHTILFKCKIGQFFSPFSSIHADIICDWHPFSPSI